MKLNRIFYSCVAIGIAFGMSIMVLMQGIGGSVDIKDALAAFVILGAGAGLGAVSMVKKLRVIWNNNITLRFQRNKPPECFICNLDSCDECEVLRVWRLR